MVAIFVNLTVVSLIFSNTDHKAKQVVLATLKAKEVEEEVGVEDFNQAQVPKVFHFPKRESITVKPEMLWK